MQVVLWILLGLLLLVLVLAAAVLWHCWEIHLAVKNLHIRAELHGFGMKKTVLNRDFSQKAQEAEKQDASPQKKGKKEKKNPFIERLQADKKRIYDEAQGGYIPGGLGEVLADYKEMWAQLQETFSGFFRSIRYKIQVPKTKIRLDFGTGNPAHTGMLCGTVWGVVGMIYPLFLRYIRMAYPEMEVTPDYQEKRWNLEIESIIKVRPAHIIHALLYQGWRVAALAMKKYFTKGSYQNGRKQTSD